MATRVKLLKNLSLIVVVALVVTLAPALSVIGEEVITLTTIMPSQDTLRVKRGAVGLTYRETATLSNDDIGAGNLLIEGNVGIGTTSPQSSQDSRTIKLDVVENIVAKDVYLDNPKSGSARWASEGGGGGFSPDPYTGQQSVTFPNGLILKKGRVALVSNVNKTVTFATPFPNAIENVQFTQTNSVHIHGYSWRVSSRTVNYIVLHSDADSGMYDWMAWGW